MMDGEEVRFDLIITPLDILTGRREGEIDTSRVEPPGFELIYEPVLGDIWR